MIIHFLFWQFGWIWSFFIVHHMLIPESSLACMHGETLFRLSSTVYGEFVFVSFEAGAYYAALAGLKLVV